MLPLKLIPPINFKNVVLPDPTSPITPRNIGFDINPEITNNALLSLL